MKTIVTASSTSPIAIKGDVQVSESKGKKHHTPRQAFFSLLMKELAGDTGNEVAEMLVKGDDKAFKAKMREIADNVAEQASKKDFSHL
jgi:hypothetical protein